LLLTALLAAGCAAVHRPPATTASIALDGDRLRDVEQATVDSIVDRLARRAVARGDRTLDILLLSGGGQNGAFGAGFLRGWHARRDAPMPTFDLVTGVSTGALQAPFAFLGTGPALDTLAAMYRRSAETIAPTIDWWFWLRRTGGLVKTGRLRRTVATVLDSTMRERLLDGVRDGRQLAIATTDFDLGVGRTWDLGEELRRSADSLARVHTLLLTSSSIPGVFPPQVVDGHVHADGGVIANIRSVLDLADYERLARAARVAGLTEPLTVRLWVLMNLWTQAPTAVVNPASRKAMNARTTTLLFWGAQPQLLQRLDALGRAVTHGVHGVRLEVRYASIPAALATEPGADRLFERTFMLRLEHLGYERAQGPAPWDTLPHTPYQRPR